MVVASAICGAFLLLSLGVVFAYLHHYVHKLRHDVFVDVAGNFAFGFMIIYWSYISLSAIMILNYVDLIYLPHQSIATLSLPRIFFYESLDEADKK